MKHTCATRAILAGIAGTLLLVVALLGTGCDYFRDTRDRGSEERSQEVTQYYCPMHCEGDKTYDEAGTCPVCDMNLVVVDAEYDEHAGHDHNPPPDPNYDQAHDHEAGAHD